MKFNLSNSRNRCKQYRKRIIEISKNVQALHIGGSFSSVEIVDCIYNNFLNSKNGDKFILSKGHAGILQYVILEDLGILSKNDIENYCKKNGILGVHPDLEIPGINASTGSLGHGLAMAAGMALANKKNKSIFYVVMSDGELQEGSVWEAVLNISSLNLKNIVIVIDNNNLQSSTKTTETHPTIYPIKEKFESFGWKSAICNGHNSESIYKKIKKRDKRFPFALIAKTIKGYPISFMKNVPMWHYRSPNENERIIALKELEKKL